MSCRAGWSCLLRFSLSVVLVSLALSVLALPWVNLSWWTVFRRCVSIAAALSVWWCIKQEGRQFASYGLPSVRAGKRHLLLGIVLGAGVLALMLSLGLLSGVCEVSVTPDRMKLWRTLLSFLPIAVLVGVLEELVFRGFILQHLLVYSRALAIAGSSLAYSLVHLKVFPFSSMTGMELIGLFFLGVVLALGYLRTHQLYFPIGLHAALAYGARTNKLMFELDPTINWLIGTNRLVNGLAGWLVLLGLAGLVMWWGRSSQGGAKHG